MRVKNSKFLNTAPKVLGIKIKEIAVTIVAFYLGMILTNSQLISFSLATAALISMVFLRKYPSFYVLHYFFRDERLQRPQEVENEDN